MSDPRPIIHPPRPRIHVVPIAKICAVGAHATLVRRADGSELWIPNNAIHGRPRPRAGDYNVFLQLASWFAEKHFRSVAGTAPAAHTPGSPGREPRQAQDAARAVGSPQPSGTPEPTATLDYEKQAAHGRSPTALRARASSSPS